MRVINKVKQANGKGSPWGWCFWAPSRKAEIKARKGGELGKNPGSKWKSLRPEGAYFVRSCRETRASTLHEQRSRGDNLPCPISSGILARQDIWVDVRLEWTQLGQCHPVEPCGGTQPQTLGRALCCQLKVRVAEVFSFTLQSDESCLLITFRVLWHSGPWGNPQDSNNGECDPHLHSDMTYIVIVSKRS